MEQKEWFNRSNNGLLEDRKQKKEAFVKKFPRLIAYLSKNSCDYDFICSATIALARFEIGYSPATGNHSIYLGLQQIGIDRKVTFHTDFSLQIEAAKELNKRGIVCPFSDFRKSEKVYRFGNRYVELFYDMSAEEYTKNGYAP